MELRGNSFVSPVSDIPLSGSEFTAGILALVDDLSLPGLSAVANISILLILICLFL